MLRFSEPTRFYFHVCITCCNIHFFGLDMSFLNLNNFRGTGKRLWVPPPWSRYANTALNYDKSILCQYYVPCWLFSESKASGLPLCTFGTLWSLKCSIARLESKQKICANIDYHWSKKYSFLCMQTNWICPSEAQGFCKNGPDSSLKSFIVTRVESFCEKGDWGRVTIFLNVAQWSLSHQKS